VPATSAAPQENGEAKKLKADLAQLESTIALIPKIPEFAAATQDLEARAAAKRLALRAMKPPGARLDAARAALDRAAARRVQAEEAYRLACTTMSAADEEIARLRVDIASIEAEVAASPPPPSAQDPLQAFTAMQEAMDNMIRLAQATPGYHAEHIAQAKSHAEQLSVGFRVTLEAAKKAEEARAARERIQLDASPPPKRWRHTAKSCPRVGDAGGPPTPVPVVSVAAVDLPKEFTTPVRARGKKDFNSTLVINDAFGPCKGGGKSRETPASSPY